MGGVDLVAEDLVGVENRIGVVARGTRVGSPGVEKVAQRDEFCNWISGYGVNVQEIVGIVRVD